MRKHNGLSTLEFIILLIVFAVACYLFVPRFVELDSENIEAQWQDTKKKAEHVAETLSNKATYDRIEQGMGKSEE